MSQSLQPVFSGLHIFVIPAKLNASEVERLSSLAEAHGAIIDRQLETTQVIVTAIHATKRLLRHVDERHLNSKVIVTPDWITQCIHENTRLPPYKYTPIKSKLVEIIPSDLSLQVIPERLAPKQIHINKEDPNKEVNYRDVSDLSSRFAVHRLSPLVSPNQNLLNELGAIMRARSMDGDNRSALSYSRAISVLKAYPNVIHSSTDVMSLAGVGPKIQNMVDEFIKSGMISEAERVKQSRRTQTLILFNSVYSIGPTTARHLYDDLNLRSMNDLQDYATSVKTHAGELLRLALSLRDEFDQKISRHEVEQIAQLVAQQLSAIQKGCLYTICGGYRRGKQESNDVDVVFTHPVKGTEKGLCTVLVDRLRTIGAVTSLLHATSSDGSYGGSSNKISKGFNNGGMAGLDTALTVFRFPANSISDTMEVEVASGIKRSVGKNVKAHQLTRLHRRLDIIFAPIDAYYTAIVGWTGSTQFERDLRLWANNRGLHFDSSGIYSLKDAQPIIANSEQEVFDILGLEYISPMWRNADL